MLSDRIHRRPSVPNRRSRGAGPEIESQFVTSAGQRQCESIVLDGQWVLSADPLGRPDLVDLATPGLARGRMRCRDLHNERASLPWRGLVALLAEAPEDAIFAGRARELRAVHCPSAGRSCAPGVQAGLVPGWPVRLARAAWACSARGTACRS